MKKTIITITTRTKNRAKEVVSTLSALIQPGETIEFAIEDVEPEAKQPSDERLHRKVKR